MSEQELYDLKNQKGIATWRLHLAEKVESQFVQYFIIVIIIVNALVLGLETSKNIMSQWSPLLTAIDKACLFIFIIELLIKIVAYQLRFFRSPWNVFDLLVILVALTPGSGPWAVLRTLRVLRVLRLLTVIPSLRKVIAAFLHSIPGLAGVVAVMSIFFYTTAVLATKIFGEDYPDWFGSLGKSLYTLFQVMTLESWSMGIVRPVMQTHPQAWVFFVPFIIIATFTILNLFIGIIVSTMQELSIPQKPNYENKKTEEIIENLEKQIHQLKDSLKK